MKYKLEILKKGFDLNSYCLEGDSKYVKEKILKLFSKSNITQLRVHEPELLEEIEVHFRADSDQIEKFERLLKKLK
jgi:hypothetical protein